MASLRDKTNDLILFLLRVFASSRETGLLRKKLIHG
jgi:hypothetical protein